MRKLVSLLFVLLVSVSTLLAQTKKVTGKVTDENGSPIANASVLVKGTTVGTTTGNDGSFSLDAPTSARTLVISSLNFTAKEVSIGNGTVSVSLAASINELVEVVVSVPYGTVKKSTFTGSAGTITASTIQKQQVTSVTRVLEGLIPGVATTNGGGTPGGGTDIRIRGFGSLNASNSPLIVLNGIPYDGSLSSISTDEIETVDVLKDAAASNLYGSRAANGVIMITTKKGKKGPAQVQASIRHGISKRGIPEYDRVGAQDYYELFWEAYRNSYVYGSGQSFAAAGTSASNVLTSGAGLVYNAYNVPGNQLVNATTGKLNPNAQLLWNESWADALFQDATRTNVNVNVSGASEKANYFVSGGYLDEKGIAKFSGYKRYNFRADVNSEVSNWLKVGLSMDGATDKRDGLFAGGTATSNPFFYSRQMGPIYPVYQYSATGAPVLGADGKPALDWGVPAQMGSRPYAANSNLVGSLALDRREQKRLNGNLNTYAEITFLKDFTFKTTFGMNLFQVDGLTYQNSEFGDALNVRGRSTVSSTQNISITGNQVLTWNKRLDKHNIRALAGHENYEFRTKFVSATKTGFSYPGQYALNNAAVVEAPPSNSEDVRRIESYFGGINYDFDSKYLLSASIRTDGSSRFAPAVRWGTFYSFGLGWRIKQEKFLENVDWLNDLKLKASYGESGNDNIGLFYQYVNYFYADGFGNFNAQGRTANADLRWEGNKILNYGVDFAMFKRRLQGTVELFDRTSDDLLFDVPLAPTGVAGSSFFQNIGESRNYGVEAQVAYNVIQKKDFDWKVDVNITHFKNRLTKLPPTQKALGGIVSGNKKLNEGRSIYDFWLREFAGVDPATGLSLYYRDILGADGKPTGERVQTNDITLASFYYVGASSIPKVYGGVTNSFRYKDFQLSVLATYSYGGHFYDGNYQSIMHSGSAGTAWHTDIKNRWQKPGDVTNVPRLQNATNQDGASSRFLFDASYVNIKNITLSYNLSSSLSKTLRLKDAQFFVSVDNAYIFTSKSGGDPQQSFDGNVGANYPLYRTVTFGTTIRL